MVHGDRKRTLPQLRNYNIDKAKLDDERFPVNGPGNIQIRYHTRIPASIRRKDTQVP